MVTQGYGKPVSGTAKALLQTFLFRRVSFVRPRVFDQAVRQCLWKFTGWLFPW